MSKLDDEKMVKCESSLTNLLAPIFRVFENDVPNRFDEVQFWKEIDSLRDVLTDDEMGVFEFMIAQFVFRLKFGAAFVNKNCE